MYGLNSELPECTLLNLVSEVSLARRPGLTLMATPSLSTLMSEIWGTRVPLCSPSRGTSSSEPFLTRKPMYSAAAHHNAAISRANTRTQ